MGETKLERGQGTRKYFDDKCVVYLQSWFTFDS